MEQTQAAIGPISGNLLFYTSPEPLSRDVHSGLGVRRMDRPFAFAKAGHVVPITVAEFTFAAISYPIIFAGNERLPLAVMGINQNESLFIEEDGSFAVGGYVPAYIRRYPFVLAADEAQQRMVVCIERGADIFTEKKKADLPLFEKDGEASEYTQNAIKFCEDFEGERRRTESFVKLLSDLDLFEQRESIFNMPKEDGTIEPVKLAEYFAVSEAKLGALSPEKLAELRDNGALEKIYNHLTSLIGWDRLVALASNRALRSSGEAPAA
ncbi:MAG: SapC family protein [Caulobacterales bacterium]|nr:SapC family protein [Caulobacterales bacterium]